MDKLVGYAWLVNHYQLTNIYLERTAKVTKKFFSRQWVRDPNFDYFKSAVYPGELPMAQLAFALKNERLQLGLVKHIFELLSEQEVIDYIASRPSSKGARRLGYLYELLLDKQITIDKAVGGAYIDLLDATKYITGSIVKSSRWRINDNLLGNKDFCPVILRSDPLVKLLTVDITEKLNAYYKKMTQSEQYQVTTYLLAKECRASCTLEGVDDSNKAYERLLQLMVNQPLLPNDLSESILVRMRNLLVDERYSESGYRASTAYIGEFMPDACNLIRNICPEPNWIPSMINGLDYTYKRMEQHSPVLRAAVLGFGFYFIYPFTSGNRRLHRYLMHAALQKEGVVPQNMIIPFSLSMAADTASYEQNFDAYYKSMRAQLQYDMSDDYQMKFLNASMVESFYRYPNMTHQATYFYQSLIDTIHEKIDIGYDFIRKYQEFKVKVRNVIDLPAARLDLLGTILYKNEGAIPAKARTHFAELSKPELDDIQSIYKTYFPSDII